MEAEKNIKILVDDFLDEILDIKTRIDFDDTDLEAFFKEKVIIHPANFKKKIKEIEDAYRYVKTKGDIGLEKINNEYENIKGNIESLNEQLIQLEKKIYSKEETLLDLTNIEEQLIQKKMNLEAIENEKINTIEELEEKIGVVSKELEEFETANNVCFKNAETEINGIMKNAYFEKEKIIKNGKQLAIEIGKTNDEENRTKRAQLAIEFKNKINNESEEIANDLLNWFIFNKESLINYNEEIIREELKQKILNIFNKNYGASKKFQSKSFFNWLNVFKLG